MQVRFSGSNGVVDNDCDSTEQLLRLHTKPRMGDCGIGWIIKSNKK